MSQHNSSWTTLNSLITCHWHKGIHEHGIMTNTSTFNNFRGKFIFSISHLHVHWKVNTYVHLFSVRMYTCLVSRLFTTQTCKKSWRVNSNVHSMQCLCFLQFYDQCWCGRANNLNSMHVKTFLFPFVAKSSTRKSVKLWNTSFCTPVYKCYGIS